MYVCMYMYMYKKNVFEKDTCRNVKQIFLDCVTIHT